MGCRSWVLYWVSAFCLVIIVLPQLIAVWFFSDGQIPYSLVPDPVPKIFLIRPCHILQTFWFLIFIVHHIPDPCVLNSFPSLSDSYLDPVYMSLTLCVFDSNVLLLISLPDCDSYTCLFLQPQPLNLNWSLGSRRPKQSFIFIFPHFPIFRSHQGHVGSVSYMSFGWKRILAHSEVLSLLRCVYIWYLVWLVTKGI